MPQAIQESWEAFHDLRSQGAIFGAARELAKVKFWSEGLPPREKSRWRTALGTARLSPAETAECEQEVVDRIARARQLMTEADSLCDDELLLVVTIVLEVALVRGLLRSADLLDDIPGYSDFVFEFRAMFEGPRLQQRLGSLVKQIRRNANIDLNNILDDSDTTN